METSLRIAYAAVPMPRC